MARVLRRPGRGAGESSPARLPGNLQWVGTTTASAGQPAKPRLVAVVEQKKWVKNDEGEGGLLLATDRGLRTFAIEGGRIATPPLDAGGRPVSHLVRDGRGRLWLGGEGLAVLDGDAKTLHPLDELPIPGRSTIDAMAADPGHPDGAIAAVEDRGVVFVRVDAR
jgi:hypothetical protein